MPPREEAPRKSTPSQLPGHKRKLALLVNMIAPTRIPLYSILSEQFDLLLLHGGQEANRDTWTDFAEALPRARVVRALGMQIAREKRVDGEAFDIKFLHVTPGFIWHLLRFQPAAVISNEMGIRSVTALTYGTIFRKPVWIWWGGTLHTERNIGAVRKMVRKIISLWADQWISYGQTSTEYLLSLGVKRERIFQSQNSTDDERFLEVAPPLWEIQPRPVVLYSGQFIERKGVSCLLDAAARVQKLGHEFSLLLVGNGRDKSRLEQRSNALGLQNVHFRPAQTPDKMPSVYRSADLFVLPTLEDVWGLAANEATLSDLVVLCSKYAGCAGELFSPENIFAPDDPQEFALKLEMAVSGRLPKTDRRRLKSAQQVGQELVQEVNRHRNGATGPVVPAPEPSLREFYDMEKPMRLAENFTGTQVSPDAEVGHEASSGPSLKNQENFRGVRSRNGVETRQLHLGCFDAPAQGWTNTDITPHIWISRIPIAAHVLRLAGKMSTERLQQHRDGVFRKLSYLNVAKDFPYSSDAFRAIFTCHMLEHLCPPVAIHCLRECHRVLQRGGVLRIVIPDLDRIVSNYDSEAPNGFLQSIFEYGRGLEKNSHHWHYNYRSLSAVLRDVGFSRMERCEYRVGACPDVEKLDKRPESLFVEAYK